MTAELIKSWIVRDLGEAHNQHAHRILRGRLSRKIYLLFQLSIILRYFLKSEKSKHGLSLEFLEIKGVDRPMQGLSSTNDREHILNATEAFFDMTSS